MNEITPTTYIKYFVSALLLGLLFFATGNISEALQIDSLDIIIKILIIIAICIYAARRDEFNSFFNIDFSPVYLLIIVIPVIFSFILQNCPLDFEPYPSFVITTVVGTITTAIWEELYFRYVGCSLFIDRNGKYKWYNVIFLAVAFSIGHIFNLFFNGATATFNQIFFTIGLGIFLLALYIHTRSIIVPIIAHFCINSVADYFTLYATEEAQAMAYIGDFFNPFLAVYIVVLIVLGFIILKRHDHLG